MDTVGAGEWVGGIAARFSLVLSRYSDFDLVSFIVVFDGSVINSVYEFNIEYRNN